MVSLHGRHINLFIERGPALGRVFEVTVDTAEQAKLSLVKNGCEIVKHEPDFPRFCGNDPFGLIYNLTAEDGSPQERRTPTSRSAGHGVRARRRRQPFFQTLFGSSLVAARCGYRGRPVCVAQLPALFPILGESGKVSSFVDAMPFGVQLDFAP